MKDKVYMSDLHFEHKIWENQLTFQKEELHFFKKRLSEVANRWTEHKVLQQVEHFQNVFMVHSNKIDELQHNINVHEDGLVKRTKENPVAIDHVHFDDHKEQRDAIETQIHLYNEVKAEYLNFLRMAM